MALLAQLVEHLPKSFPLVILILAIALYANALRVVLMKLMKLIRRSMRYARHVGCTIHGLLSVLISVLFVFNGYTC